MFIGDGRVLVRVWLCRASKGSAASLAKRPGGIDTNFIQRAQGEWAAYVAAGASQSTSAGRAKQERSERDVLVKRIVAARKKIQYAADAIWPAGKPESAQARSDFLLPGTRSYSY